MRKNYVPKGSLEGFPVPVIKKMLEYQVQQGNVESVEVFEEDKIAGFWSGGFNWDTTPEGSEFWQNVIVNKEFDLFTMKYVDASEFKTILNSLADLLEHKNKLYGNSALEPMQVFEGKCKVGQRVDDKLARIKNSDELRKNDVADLMGYLTLICVEKDWKSFDEFKD